MAEDTLQLLIDRLQREAVDDAKAQAERIVEEARARARAEVEQAQAKAKALLAQADKDAEAFAARATRTLEQSARDVLIGVGRGVEQIFAALVLEAVGAALDVPTLQSMLVKMAEAYVQRGQRDRRIEVLLSEAERDEFVQRMKARLRELAGEGIDVHVDRHVGKGFRVQLQAQRLHHDFTQAAIAEALAGLLRPQLAEIVRRVAVTGAAKAATRP